MKIQHLKYISLLFFILSCTSPQEYKFFIGFSQCTTADSWRKDMFDGMERELSFHPEMVLEMKDANNNSQKQIVQIQSFINKKVDLLIVSPNESEAITPIIEKAFQAGIPVILVDRRTASNKYTAFVGADNFLVGQNAGIYANILLNGIGKVIEIGGLPGSSPSIDRHKGFLSVLNKYPQIKVELINSNWEKNSFENNLAKALQIDSSVKLIFAQNDRLALAVHQLLLRLGLSKKIKIIGVDGLADENGGLDMVNKGMINATILYPTGGEEAIQVAAKILKKKSFRKENILFSTIIDAKNVRIVLSQTQKMKGQQGDILRQSTKLKTLNQTYSSQRNRLYFITVLLSILILLGALLLYLLREKQHSNKILEEQNHAILEQKNEIEKVSMLARKATEDKMRFYSYISHEFKTPLSLILTPAEDLLHRKSIEPKENRTTLELIVKNANRLLRLVDQLLELRKLDAGKIELHGNQNDLRTFVKDIVGDFSVKAKSQQIDLQFICPFQTVPYSFDAEKLDKVFFNIISNAFKYTPKGGLIHVTLLKNVDKIEVIIADNGIGMNEEEKTHAFDLFYRGNQNISLGTGLGLALSQEFVTLHGGQIELNSEKEKGTTFKVILPCNQEGLFFQEPIVEMAVLKVHHVDNDFITGKKAMKQTFENTIVLIEDNHDLNDFLTQKLSQYYNISASENAEIGWEEILNHIPDLIISDVMLPGMDGFSLIQKVKSDFRTSHIPVILLTAKGQIENQIEGTKAGADAYIPKPFNQQLFEEKIKGLLENRDRMRRRFSNEVKNPSNLQKGERKFLIEFEALIEKNIKDSSLSVEKLSYELGMSRVQLFRKISALTNKNVTDYIAEFKLQKAKALLSESEKNIAEIAYETGFNNPSYFTTFFKQKTNKTPSEWRNQ